MKKGSLPIKDSSSKRNGRGNFIFGVCLVEFMHERNLIVYNTISGSVIDIYNKSGYKDLKTYASCTFDIKSLPLRLNLPMIYKPLDWKIKKEFNGSITLNDVEGGYLNRFVDFRGRIYRAARKASDPFQFIAKYLYNDRVTDDNRIVGLNKVPLSQDAAASAYQIMSYLLLNIEIGKLTNLIPSQEDEVKDEDFDEEEYLIEDEYDLLSEDEKSQMKYKLKDLYISFKEELLKFLKSRLEPNKYSIIQSELTRKVVKQLFKRLIYGSGSPAYWTLGIAISLYDEDNNKFKEILDIYKSIFDLSQSIVDELYENDELICLTIRFYLNKDYYNYKIKESPPSEEDIDQNVLKCMNANIDKGTEEATPIYKVRKRRYANFITKLKSRIKERRSFIVVYTKMSMLKVKDEEKYIQVPYTVVS
ncbi:hypothetical protein Ddye_020517 [Dipteronia dyeriana]|uniref:DNA-directed RNA polymerase n=1 Tax=Dipteronia dyeriana TaxID=168575 RepID=A0AAD9U025_9ROSI|nr:hypothetical protein Ddye_020517 [Dipteronia dyeriana]